MKTKNLIVILTFIILGCIQRKPQGVEIGNLRFENLVKNKLVKSLQYQQNGDWLIIEPKEILLEDKGFRKSITEELSKGNINNEKEFRLLLKLATLEYTQKKLKRLETESGAEHLEIIILQ